MNMVWYKFGGLFDIEIIILIEFMSFFGILNFVNLFLVIKYVGIDKNDINNDMKIYKIIIIKKK